MAKTALEIIQEDRAKLSNIIIENLNTKGLGWFKAVSYTHLDVYKRQGLSTY